MNTIKATFAETQGGATWPKSAVAPGTLGNIPPELVAHVMMYMGRDGIRLITTGHHHQQIALSYNVFKFYCSLDLPKKEDDYCTARIERDLNISEHLQPIAWKILWGMRGRKQVPLTRFIPIPGGSSTGSLSSFSRLPGGRFAIENCNNSVLVFHANGALHRTLTGTNDHTLCITEGPQQSIVKHGLTNESTWASNGTFSTTPLPQHPNNETIEQITQLSHGAVAYAYINGDVYVRNADGTFASFQHPDWAERTPIYCMIPLAHGGFMTSSQNGMAYLWDWDSHRQHYQATVLPGIDSPYDPNVCHCAQSLNGDLAVVTAAGVRVYHRNGTFHRDIPANYFGIAFFRALSDGRFAAGGGLKRTLTILNADFQPVEVIQQRHLSDVFPLPGGGLVGGGPDLPIGIWGPDVADLIPQNKPKDPKQA